MDALAPLLPFLILAMLLAAPRRGGGRASPAAPTAALLVLVLGVTSPLFGALWNRFGLYLAWKLSGVE